MTTRSLLAAAAMSAMCMAPAFAQTDATRPTMQPPASKPTGQPPKSPPGMPSKDQMAEMMEKMATPGPNHALLNGMVGEWNADCKFWMDPTPGAQPTTSKGTSVHTWDMGKRFVKQQFNGSFTMDPSAPPMPFSGLGYTGYDNQKQKFVGTWMDSMSTGIMYSEGTYDAGSKTFTFTSQCTDPMTNQPSTMTQVIKVLDDNTHTFTMSTTGPDGKDMKVGEITYTRKGGKPTDGMPSRDLKPMTPGTPPSTTTPPGTKPPVVPPNPEAPKKMPG
jgi:hypothetical protein